MKYLLTALITFGVFISLDAQNNYLGLLSPAGAYATSSEGSLSWSVGELAVHTYSAGNQALTQGFQQNSMKLTPVFEVEGRNIQLDVFPNPAIQTLTLKSGEGPADNLSYELINLYGQLMLRGQATGLNTSINLTPLPAQTYILNVFSAHGKKVAVFKIQKID